MLTPYEKAEMEKLCNGLWADTDVVCKVLHITFATGLKIFDFSRTAQWNAEPLQGQKITTLFKIKPEAKDVFAKNNL